MVEFKGVQSIKQPCPPLDCLDGSEVACCLERLNNVTATDNFNYGESGNKDVYTDSILYNLSFSLPIHLRYHSPHSLMGSLPLFQRPGGTDFSHKIIRIKNPDIYISKLKQGNSNNFNMNYDGSNDDNDIDINMKLYNNRQGGNSEYPPLVTRIYDVSFLGQRGNFDLSDGCSYIQISSNHRGSSDNNYDFNGERSNDSINKITHSVKESLQEISLYVPVGYIEHGYVLPATVFCYLCTAAAILYTLIT